MISYKAKPYWSASKRTLMLNFVLCDIIAIIAMHCGFRFNKDEVMEMDFQAYLASSDEECSNDEEWATTAEGNKTLTEEEKIANYRV